MPRTQTPKEQFISHQNAINYAVFQQMKTVDLFDVENYGAQYLHPVRCLLSNRVNLRCGLMSHYTRLHLLRYLYKCGFGDGVLVRLYPYRTLTDK